MVKREKSPEVTEDVRLFVVWVPYPLNPNWIFEQTVQDCAKWVAEVIANEYYLISIHQKPSSRGMILLEISKEFTDHRRLLGEHQWSNFLKDATKEEEGHKTCVYYGIYRTCREARKDGWNPIPIPTKWFKDWSPGSGRFVSPYPEPKYCPLPPEDRTSKPICRHVPLKKSTPMKPNDPPVTVVGSPAWTARQTEEAPSSESTAGTWRRQVEGATTSNFAATSRVTQMGETSDLRQAPQPPSVLPRSKSKAIPLQKFMSQPGVPQKKVQAPWVGRSLSSTSRSTGQRPPAVVEPPTNLKPQNAWTNPLKIVPLKPAKVTTNPDSMKSWQISHESWADMVEDENHHLEASDTTLDEVISPKATQVLASTHGNFNLEVLTNSLNEAEVSPVPSPTYQHSDDEGELDVILAPMGSFNSDGNNRTIPEFTQVRSNEGSEDKDWSKAWSDAEEDLEKKKQEILCPTHGPACSKKICQDYNKLVKEQKREEAKKSGQSRGGRFRGRFRGRGPFSFRGGA